jgi:hypothetical protein
MGGIFQVMKQMEKKRSKSEMQIENLLENRDIRFDTLFMDYLEISQENDEKN